MAKDADSPPEPLSKSQKPTSGDDFWTLERMRGAQPMELPHPDQPPRNPLESGRSAVETGPSTGGAGAEPKTNNHLGDEDPEGD